MIPFVLNGRRMDTFAVVSPDVEEVMIGSDWLEEHRCLWNFGDKQLSIDGHSVATVTEGKNLRCRRLYSEEDVAIPPRQQVEAPVRSTLSSLTPPTTSEMVETREVKPGVYIERALLTPELRGQTVSIVNTTDPMVLKSGTWLGDLRPVKVVNCPEVPEEALRLGDRARKVFSEGLPKDLTPTQHRQVTELMDKFGDIILRNTIGVPQTLWVKCGYELQTGGRSGGAYVASESHQDLASDEGQPTVQGHEMDGDRGGSWSGVEPSIAAPEYGDTEHGGRAGVVPKDPVVREVTPNVTSEYGEQWADPGYGWCRVAGTDDDPGVETRRKEVGGRQRVANIPVEGPAPAPPNIVDAQWEDENIAPILTLRIQSSAAPTFEDMVGAPEKVMRLWSEWDHLEVINGALYRRISVTKNRRTRSILQLIVPERLTEQFIKDVHAGATGGHLGLRRTMDEVRRRGFWFGWCRSVKQYCLRCRCFSEHHQRRPQKAEPPIERLRGNEMNKPQLGDSHQKLASRAVMKNPEIRPEGTYHDSPGVRMVNPNSCLLYTSDAADE